MKEDSSSDSDESQMIN